MTTPGRSERTGVNPRHEDVITSILLGGDQYEPYSIVLLLCGSRSVVTRFGQWRKTETVASFSWTFW